MKGILKKGYFFGLLAVLAMLVGAVSVHAQARPVAKVDNFIIFPDQSGSMYMTHQELEEVKIEAAKRLMMDMNQMIPELGYQGSLYMYAPFQEVLAPRVYQTSDMASAIQRIPDTQQVFGRVTPLGDGLRELDSVLGQLSGRTAVIVVGDGEDNAGRRDAIEQASQLVQKYPNVCFHVISFAETREDRETNEELARINNCILVEGTELLASRGALDQFVRDVFYGEEVVEIREPDVVVLRGIQFAFDRSDILPEWRPVLDEGARVLMDNPEINVVIEGHTCNIGTDSYNLGLSERRAASVKNYFVERGISEDRMTTVGYGMRRPIADNSTVEGRRLNRRVELRVSN